MWAELAMWQVCFTLVTVYAGLSWVRVWCGLTAGDRRDPAGPVTAALFQVGYVGSLLAQVAAGQVCHVTMYTALVGYFVYDSAQLLGLWVLTGRRPWAMLVHHAAAVGLLVGNYHHPIVGTEYTVPTVLLLEGPNPGLNVWKVLVHWYRDAPAWRGPLRVSGRVVIGLYTVCRCWLLTGLWLVYCCSETPHGWVAGVMGGLVWASWWWRSALWTWWAVQLPVAAQVHGALPPGT